MKWKNDYRKVFTTLLVAGFILLSNFVVLVDFTIAQEKSCCDGRCQCDIDHDCEMTIECGTAHVVILIPLLRTEEEKNLTYVLENDFHRDFQEYSELTSNYGPYKSTPILITPSTYTNTPLLI